MSANLEIEVNDNDPAANQNDATTQAVKVVGTGRPKLDLEGV